MFILTCKQAAASWRISETKVTQAGDPAFYKVAAVILDHPETGMAELAAWISEVRHRRQLAIEQHGGCVHDHAPRCIR